MSMTQRVIDELREIADSIDSESRKARREDRKLKFQAWARCIRECADDLGDD